ncbi:hypothetical protein B0H63DRAFT_449292 [Podospora didyma]|uniref:Uncharacterized protein n=1 Tax=Podospora didyma TaxID=330526 RepID=A0AAE0NPC9_9PEZI|nr:hypothetical protein B0H63DRAFT_449292 [Podospora didyma]
MGGLAALLERPPDDGPIIDEFLAEYGSSRYLAYARLTELSTAEVKATKVEKQRRRPRQDGRSSVVRRSEPWTPSALHAFTAVPLQKLTSLGAEADFRDNLLATVGGKTIEVQLMLLLMHALVKMHHELIYKPVVIAGEQLLRQIQINLDRKKELGNIPFRGKGKITCNYRERPPAASQFSVSRLGSSFVTFSAPTIASSARVTVAALPDIFLAVWTSSGSLACLPKAVELMFGLKIRVAPERSECSTTELVSRRRAPLGWGSAPYGTPYEAIGVGVGIAA